MPLFGQWFAEYARQDVCKLSCSGNAKPNFPGSLGAWRQLRITCCFDLSACPCFMSASAQSVAPLPTTSPCHRMTTAAHAS